MPNVNLIPLPHKLPSPMTFLLPHDLSITGNDPNSQKASKRDLWRLVENNKTHYPFQTEVWNIPVASIYFKDCAYLIKLTFLPLTLKHSWTCNRESSVIYWMDELQPLHMPNLITLENEICFTLSGQTKLLLKKTCFLLYPISSHPPPP